MLPRETQAVGRADRDGVVSGRGIGRDVSVGRDVGLKRTQREVAFEILGGGASRDGALLGVEGRPLKPFPATTPEMVAALAGASSSPSEFQRTLVPSTGTLKAKGTAEKLWRGYIFWFVES